MAATGISFNLKGVAGELKERLLAVPIYQRSYAWGPDEVSEYWSDLRNAFAEGSLEYFLGTVVLTKQGAAGGRDTIIDGQQRLATTSILLAAIRDEFTARGDENRAKIVQSGYLSTSDLATATEISRLYLNSEDADFFDKRVVGNHTDTKPAKASHKLIAGALDYLREQITKVADDAGPEWAKRLTQWVDLLQTRVKAIVLEVPTEADAFLIFETLNDRGADLTIADLLKNYLFGHAGLKLDQVRDGWMQILGILEIAAENKLFIMFLRHYWSSMQGAVRERELFKSIKDNVTNEAQVVQFVVDLQAASALYAALLHSDDEYWDALGTTVRENVESLLRLGLEQHRPLLLAAMQYFGDPEKKKLLRALVSWSVRGIVVGGIGGGTAERNYCQAAVKIRKGAIKTTDEVLAEIGAIVPSDDDLESAFSRAQVPKSALARYYLIALERGHSAKK